jgi:ribA/ribD-fused uncharacterized protein
MVTKMSKCEIRFYRASGEYGFMSNLWFAPMVFENNEFFCSEEAYQYGKPKDKVVAKWLVSAPYPHLCAMAAHGLFCFDVKPDWNNIKVERMRQVLKAKFTQHPDLSKKLIATEKATLVEASKSDAFWGIGKKGNGKNMLGLLLMEIRTELQLPVKELENKRKR